MSRLGFVVRYRFPKIRDPFEQYIFYIRCYRIGVVCGGRYRQDLGFRVSHVGGDRDGNYNRLVWRYDEDILINEEPLIFRKDIYALACVFGGLIYYICMQTSMSAAMIQFVSALSVFLARIIAVKYHISVPVLKGEE